MSGLSLKEICFVSIIGGEDREEKGVSYRLRLVSSARKRQSNRNLFHPRLLLSRYVSSPPRCQSAPVFNFHRSSCSCSSLTIDRMKENNQNIPLKAKSTLQSSCTAFQHEPQTGCELIPVSEMCYDHSNTFSKPTSL